MSDNIDKELAEIKGLIDNDYTVPSENVQQTHEKETPHDNQQNCRKRSVNGGRPSCGRKQQKRSNMHIYIAAGVAVLLLLLILVSFKSCAGADPLQGTWDMDGTTVYRFDGDGVGAMVLPSRTYSFQYTINADAKTVHIDFDDERAADYTYDYEVSETKLILSGREGKETFSYEFTKKDS